MAWSFPTGSFARAVSAVALAAFPACGGGSNPVGPPATTLPAPPPTTLAPVPAKLSDLTASVTSPQADANVSCDTDIRARVTLTNRAASSVVVTGVLLRSGVVVGRCRGDSEFTYRALNRTMAPNTTTVVLDQGLYDTGPGCCSGQGCAGSCRIEEGFEVVTEIGNVPAGAFNYTLFFQNCKPCLRGASTGGFCPPASLGTPE